MKRSLSISILINVFLIALLFAIVLLAYQYRLIPFYTSTHNSISDISESYSEDSISFNIVADNLEIPWSMIFINNDQLLVTERPGRIQQVSLASGEQKTILDLTDTVVSIGEAGLMSIVKDPDFQNNKLIYIYHTYNNNAGDILLKVAKYKYENENLIFDKDVISDIPSGRIHSGGAMAVGPDEMLYITTGDIASPELAQNLNSLAGKTLRLDLDGNIPEDNPFVISTGNSEGIACTENTRCEIWSYGHRNAQGLDWHPVTLELYQSEHGPSGFDGGTGMDEINLIRRGQNYGWPIIRGNETKKGMQTPLVEYTPAIAPAAAVFYPHNNFMDLENRLLVAALRGQAIIVLEIDGERINEQYRLVDDSFGRIRAIQIGPDENIYFSTSNRDGRGQIQRADDKIIQITIN
jgi:aldose sugar dehydrogenase